MKLLAVHPGPLMYTRIFLRLEPLGLELVAEAARLAGHEVRLIDLQVETHRNYFRLLDEFRPDAICFSCNYLANVPEIVDLAKASKIKLPRSFIFVGGHSASFTADEFLAHGNGAIDCVLRGEGEAQIAKLLVAAEYDRGALDEVPGTISEAGEGPPPAFVTSLDDIRPARDLLRHRRKYFIGHLDPAASIEFSRGCPWDCAFCSAWTFYGRSYRTVSPEVAVDELKRIREPGVFIVDDVAFIQERHGMEIAEGAARAGIRKSYYLETRADVMLRNKEVFKVWRKLGVKYVFMGFEAIDEDGLKKFRKRVDMGRNYEALEYARSLGFTVAINIIADPDWDEARFRAVREWCLSIPEVVNISVNTPYPGTETWHSESRKLTSRDYRLFDIQHAVLPTRLPLDKFYAELIETQRVMAKKHMGLRAMRRCAAILANRLAHGQTNFLRMIWRFNKVYSTDLLLADHNLPVSYEMTLPPGTGIVPERRALYIHKLTRPERTLDQTTERFVEATRLGAAE
jgi:magnesium-protoporphyrin IX monomethyl ester (oxidative) cyclase